VPEAALLWLGLARAGRRLNWSHIDSRNRMRRQGVEDIKGKAPVVPPKRPRRKVSKADLRQQAAAAFLTLRGFIPSLSESSRSGS
jgi:hypothetical protein